MRKIAVFAIVALLAGHSVQSQSTLSFGVLQTSLSTTSAGAVNGTSFALPGGAAAVITWQVVADGSALSTNLQHSLDNSAWSNLDTQSVAAGGTRTVTYFVSSKYIRIIQTSRTGGTATTGTIIAQRGFNLTSTSTGMFNSNLLFNPDGLYNIGAFGVNSPHTVYASNSMIAPRFSTTSASSVSGGFRDNNNGSKMFFPSNGVLTLLDSAGTDWNRLQFGGTTSAFPALARSGDLLQSVLADGSTYTDFRARYFLLGARGSFRAPTTDGVIIIANAGGTDFSMLQFGGTTSSFPALKRSGADLHVRLADDSSMASMVVNSLTTNPAGLSLGANTLAAIGGPADGAIRYCSDCLYNSNPCTGSSTGAIAKRIAGAWRCD